MRKTKLLAVAAGFLAAAGLTTAGNIYVGSTQVGSYDGNITVTGTGDLRLPSNTQLEGVDGGDGGNTQECGLNASPGFTACQCDPGYESPAGNGSTTVDYGVDCVLSDDGSDPGGGGETDPPPSTCGETPAGFSRDTSRTSFDTFPGTKGTTWALTIRDQEYLAVNFTTQSTSGDYGAMFFISDTHATPGFFTAAISKCPGDFRPLNGDPNCRVAGSSLNFYWQVHNSSSQYTCDLRPGQQYYFNMIYGEGQGNSFRDTCTARSCGHLMQWDNG